WIVEHSTTWDVLVYAWVVIALVPVVGFAIATERVAVAIVACVVGLAAAPPPFLEKLVFDNALAIGEHKMAFGRGILDLVHVLVISGLVVIAARVEAITEVPEDAVRGFRHASYALGMRVVAAVIVPLATLMMWGTRTGGGAEDAAKLLQYGTVGAL